MRVAAWAAALALLACAHGPFDSGALLERHPELAGIEGQRLGDGNPYPLPRDDVLRWFLCRWTLERPLRVSLPAEIGARDRELLLVALTSLESAGLGLRFEVGGEPEDADIRIRLGEKDASKSGRTAADCAVSAGEGRLEAMLVRAEVALQRENESVIGKQIALSDAEWVGAAIHELGHALGFQGHVRGGAGPMVRNVEQVRAIGRKVLAGKGLEAPTLRALYALPSGTILRRDGLPPGRTGESDRLDLLARSRGYRGPFVRVGDRSARLEWWQGAGRSVSVWLPDIPAVAREPSALRLVPDPVAAAWLGPSG